MERIIVASISAEVNDIISKPERYVMANKQKGAVCTMDKPYLVRVDLTKVNPGETVEIEVRRGQEQICIYEVIGGDRTTIRVGRPAGGGDITVSPSKKP